MMRFSPPKNAVLSALESYSRAVELSPLRTAVATGASLWAIGNLLVQMVVEPKIRREQQKLLHGQQGEQQSNKHHPLQRGRFVGSVLFGGSVCGVVANYWYTFLERVALATPQVFGAPQSSRFVVAKVCCDLALFQPFTLVAFFMIVGLLEGREFWPCWREMQNGFVDGMKVEVGVWGPTQLFNFALVPVKLQVLVVNLAALGEAVLLSILQGAGTNK